ncbi:hypothetical protein OQA88_1733 [Cercophora sp. LCS_1]
MKPLLGLLALILPVLSVDPLVDLTYRKYTGQALPNNITQWLGMRYAAPPVGSRRFKPPRDPITKNTPEPATTPGPVCQETTSQLSPLTSEDCLFISVYAPTPATPKSRLPVYIFIQGGGFNKNSNPNLNGQGIISASNNSIIFVTFNYRVGLFGFLAHPKYVKANNGLRDQIKALEWVQKYISRFGGDPHKITLGGASAGGMSVLYHMMRNDTLFSAVAVSSLSFSTVLTQREARYQFENLAVGMGCATDNPVGCLRNVSVKDLVRWENEPLPGAGRPPLYMWGPVVDGDVVRGLPYETFKDGNFRRVPGIFGTATNDGTMFAPREAADIGAANWFVKNQFPGLEVGQLARLNRLYPNNGSCPGAGCWWRQASHVYSELRYVCPTLFVTSMLKKYGVGGIYGYRWNVEDSEEMAAGLGVPHTVEVNAIFGPGNVNGSVPLSYLANGANAEAVPVVQGYWASFIKSLDPNLYRHKGAAEWKTWDADEKERLLFYTGGHTGMESIEGDLVDRCKYWESIALDLSQ